MIQPTPKQHMGLELSDCVVWDLASNHIHKPIRWIFILGQLKTQTLKIRQGFMRRSEEDSSTTKSKQQHFVKKLKEAIPWLMYRHDHSHSHVS